MLAVEEADDSAALPRHHRGNDARRVGERRALHTSSGDIAATAVGGSAGRAAAPRAAALATGRWATDLSASGAIALDAGGAVLRSQVSRVGEVQRVQHAGGVGRKTGLHLLRLRRSEGCSVSAVGLGVHTDC